MVKDTTNRNTRKNSLPKLERSRFKSKPKALDYLTGLEFRPGDPYFKWRPKGGKGFIAYSRNRPTNEELMAEYDPNRFQSFLEAE